MKVLKFLNLSFFIIMIAVNFLANLLPLGHGNTGEISVKYENLFTPAPITFSIWGVIYILVALFIIFQLNLFGDNILARKCVELIGIWFIVSCVMNIGWLFSWHYDIIWLSMIFMLGLLLSLIIIVTRYSPIVVMRETGIETITFMSRLSFYAFEVYLGWITAATIANVSVLLVKLGWNRFGLSSEFWTILVIIVGAILGMLFVLSGHRYMSAAAVIWAYCGILIKHISQSGYGGKYPSIIAATIAGIIAILSTIIINLILRMGSTT